VALGWGVGGVVFYLVFTVGVFIWNQSLDLISTNPDPIWVRMGAGLEYTFISQMGVTFTAPVVIWGIAFLVNAKFEMGNGK
jgi:hypothetical protein